MSLPRTLASLVALTATLSLALTACKDEPPPKPTFTPGADTELTLAALGGLMLSAPDNLKLSESAGEAKLEAEGFPTLTLTHKPGEYDMTGTQTSTSMDDVSATYTIPTAEWTCKAESTGDHKELVKKICGSMKAPDNPNTSKLTCKTIAGFEAEPVKAAWSGMAGKLTECLRGIDETGMAFGFNFERNEGTRNFTTYTSPILKDEAASKCIAAVYDELEKTPAFANEAVPLGQIECDGSYSRF